MPARRSLALAMILGSLSVTLSACTQVEESASTYEPVSVQPLPDTDIKQVTFTAEGARRAGVRTARVRVRGRHRVIPYAALLYGDAGDTFTIVTTKPLQYVRTPIRVGRIAGGEVALTQGPRAGTAVVTTGAAEIYSAEFGVEEE